MAADLADLFVDVPVVVVGPEGVLVLVAPRLLLPLGQLRDDPHPLLAGGRAALGQLGAAEAAGGTAFQDVRPTRFNVCADCN